MRLHPEDGAAHGSAFHAIDSDPAQKLIVGVSESDEVVAKMQLTTIPGLARCGATPLKIEAVRVRTDQRGRGVGGAMIRWAMDDAAALGATLVQLTSDATRVDAHRFYEGLGFSATHIGFKYVLPTGAESRGD